jgi:2-oxoisovalerate dehydrogenase E1 component
LGFRNFIKILKFQLGLLDLRTLQPLDTDAIFASVKKTGRVIIYQEDSMLELQVIYVMIMENCFNF